MVQIHLGYLRLAPNTNFRRNCERHKNQLPQRGRASMIIMPLRVVTSASGR